MISVSTTYNNIISNGGHYEWRIINGTNTFDKTVIISGKITSTLFTGISVGNANAAQFNLSMRNVPNINKSAPLRVQFRAASWDGSSTSDWYTKGWYYIDTIKSSPYSEIMQITAFDALMKANQPFQQGSGRWVAVTTSIAIHRIMSDMGVTMLPATESIFTSNPYYITTLEVGEKGTTDRELLEQIAAAYGGNFFIDENNHLQFYRLSSTGGSIGTAQVGDAVVRFDASEAITIRRAKLQGNGDAYSLIPGVGLSTHTNKEIVTHSGQILAAHANALESEWETLGGYCVEMNIPWATYDMAASTFYNHLDGKSFVPYDAATAYIDPKYGLWDNVEIKDITSKIVNQNLTMSALAPSNISLEYEEALNLQSSQTPYVSSTVRKLQYQVAQNSTAIQTTIPMSIANATSLITGEQGGYVKWHYLPDGTPSEVLFMDNANEDQATNILRLNRNGVGFSRNGGESYDNAWTIDGKLNADFISAGTIADASGENYWDLTTGKFVTKKGTIGAFNINDYGVIGNDGATLYPWKLQVANVNAVTNARELTGVDEQKLYFQKYPNNGSTLVNCGNIVSLISSDNYGILNIAVGSGNTSGVTLYDPNDSSRGYVCQLGDTSVLGKLDTTGAINGVYTATTLINSGSSKTFTVPSGSRHRVTVAGTVTARMAEFIVGCATNGTVGVSAINQGASISVTTGTNSMTIGASGGSASVMITTFSGSPMTFS